MRGSGTRPAMLETERNHLTAVAPMCTPPCCRRCSASRPCSRASATRSRSARRTPPSPWKLSSSAVRLSAPPRLLVSPSPPLPLFPLFGASRPESSSLPPSPRRPPPVPDLLPPPRPLRRLQARPRGGPAVLSGDRGRRGPPPAQRGAPPRPPRPPRQPAQQPDGQDRPGVLRGAQHVRVGRGADAPRARRRPEPALARSRREPEALTFPARPTSPAVRAGTDH